MIQLLSMTRYIRSHILPILIYSLLLCPAGTQAQETDIQKNSPVEVPGQSGNGKTRVFQKTAATRGNAKYLRFVNHDGNLITGGSVNSALLGYHYVSGSPQLAWPKGVSSVPYLHGGVFYVASEVTDTNGKTIHIVSDNYRRSNKEVSRDFTHFYAFMPLPRYFNLDQPAATDTPEIYGISEDVGIDGLPNTGDSGEGDGQLQPQEDFNQNGQLDLSMKNEIGWYAVSHRKETWPEYWPIGSYPGDNRSPGDERSDVRAGRWNGEYGTYARADQESFFAVDDRENDEFAYYPTDDTRAWPNGRRGLGLKAEVRNYQWSAHLAEDIFISIYDITNEGKDLEKCVVGMYIDPDMGGSLEGDESDFDNIDDITYAWNVSGRAGNGLPTGYFGFAFLESPGLAQDGIDNDQDGRTDESQNDGIDNDGDWTNWSDVNGNGQWDNEDANFNGLLDEGEDLNGNGVLDSEQLNDDVGADGLGPEYDDYTGPDLGEANGLPDAGEPNFDFTDNDESDQVGLTSWYLRDVDDTMGDDEKYWQIEIQPGTYQIRPGYQRDIAWSYGSGFVQFSGTEKTHRYAIALLFGNDQDDILRNKRTMQVIYDQDYNFAKPPRKPFLEATAGDGKVFLKWDSRAETSRDPVYGQDFEAYYIYRSTEASFGEIKTITDAFGNPLLLKPMAIFDKKDGLAGIHPVRIGSELGIESDLGISYNMGTDSGLKHYFIDSTVTNGRTYYYALVSVDRGYHPDFYPELSDKDGLVPISPTECGANILTDPLGRAISTDENTAVVVPQESPAGWQNPQVNPAKIVHTTGRGTGDIQLSIYNPYLVRSDLEYRLEFGDDGKFEQYDSLYTGNTDQMTLYITSDGNGHLPVASLANPASNNLASEFIYDGVQITMLNDPITIDTVFWQTGTSNLAIKDMTAELSGLAMPRDYEIRVMEFGADTAVNNSRVTNFQIWDVTEGDLPFKVSYRYTPQSSSKPDSLTGHIYTADRIILVNNEVAKKQLWKWDMYYPVTILQENRGVPVNGDVLKIRTTKSFDHLDKYEFSLDGNKIDQIQAKKDLHNIYTVPDPYIAVNPLERKVINADEGRGDRRVDFVNLPEKCTVYIYTSSGKLVRTLEHDVAADGSRLAWDLRTKDGLEVAHGVYFWVVDAPGVGITRGKMAIIK